MTAAGVSMAAAAHKPHSRSGAAMRGGRARYTYLHTAIDGFSRLAHTETLPDEQGRTAIGFTHRARAFFARHGITHVHRIVTDNGACCRTRDCATVLDQRTFGRRTAVLDGTVIGVVRADLVRRGRRPVPGYGDRGLGVRAETAPEQETSRPSGTRRWPRRPPPRRTPRRGGRTSPKKAELGRSHLIAHLLSPRRR